MSAIELFLAMLVGHALADYPLQGDFLAKAKNRNLPIPGVPWTHAMGAHVAIHGGMVWLITGFWWLGAMEAAMHWIIDLWKCDGMIGFDRDQTLHVLCKIAWALTAAVLS